MSSIPSASPRSSTANKNGKKRQKSRPGKQAEKPSKTPDFTEPVFYRRNEWADFRDIDRISNKAGVPQNLLPQVVIKELVDNALDSGRNVEIGWVEGPSDLCCFFVEDDGEGIPGDDDDLAELFSIRRPLTTSKQKRMPTRGMLGNGLRVVVGVVLCSKGVLRVSTKGRTLTLKPEMEEGSTAIVDRQSWQGNGTRIDVELTGDLANVAMEGDLFGWGQQALILNRGERYKGKTSPWWYGSHSFWELLQAAGHESIERVASELDGCTERGRLTDVVGVLADRSCGSITESEAAALLKRAQSHAKPVSAERLGTVGELPGLPGYAKTRDVFERDDGAKIPFVVEAWASRSGQAELTVCMNRTPVVTQFRMYRPANQKTKYGIFGGGLSHGFEVGARGEYKLLINILTPFAPLTSSGKDPDLLPMCDAILKTCKKSVSSAKKAHKNMPGPDGKPTKNQAIREIAFEVMEEAYNHASAGVGMASARQVMYAARDLIIKRTGNSQPWSNSNYFTQDLLPAYINQHKLHDKWDVLYDDRGHFEEPHTGTRLGIGTLAVRRYVHDWPKSLPTGQSDPVELNHLFPTAGTQSRYCFALFVEKEGFDELFHRVHLAERFDVGIFSTKGMSVTAARQLVDQLSAKSVTVLVLHDFDAYGFSILHSLKTDNDRYTYKNEPRVKGLGLRLKDVIELGLNRAPESMVYTGNKGITPQERLQRYGATKAEREFLVTGKNSKGEWEGQRVELNALPARGLIDFIERKLSATGVKKIVPDLSVLQLAYERAFRTVQAEREIQSVIERINIEPASPSPPNLEELIQSHFATHPTDSWDEAVYRIATGQGSDGSTRTPIATSE